MRCRSACPAEGQLQYIATPMHDYETEREREREKERERGNKKNER